MINILRPLKEIHAERRNKFITNYAIISFAGVGEEKYFLNISNKERKSPVLLFFSQGTRWEDLKLPPAPC